MTGSGQGRALVWGWEELGLSPELLGDLGQMAIHFPSPSVSSWPTSSCLLPGLASAQRNEACRCYRNREGEPGHCSPQFGNH